LTASRPLHVLSFELFLHLSRCDDHIAVGISVTRVGNQHPVINGIGMSMTIPAYTLPGPADQKLYP
jgi:hypothetical protein